MVAFLRAMLEAAGHRVHTYTSPHLVRFAERIRVSTAPGASAFIGEDKLADVLAACEAANGDDPITFFEITTAAAFVTFAGAPADVTLLEVGLGGRLDATNVVARPVATAITPVAVDHVEFLGPALAGIAAEKAGILKPGVPCVVARQAPEAAAAIVARGADVGAPMFLRDRDWWVDALKGRRFRVRTGDGQCELPPPGLAGAHQIDNAAQAVACLDHVPLAVDDKARAAGLRAARWPGRMQRLTAGPLAAALPPGVELWLDGAHNPAAARVLAAAMAEIAATDARPRPWILVTGFLETKDAAGFVAALGGVVDGLVAVPIAGHAARPPAAIAALAAAAGIPATAAPSLAAGIEAACTRDRTTRNGAAVAPPPRVLICGSLYLVGAAAAGAALADGGFGG